MDWKTIAKETLKILEQRYYECDGKRIEIGNSMDAAVRGSELITPQQGSSILEKYCGAAKMPGGALKVETANISTVEAIRKLSAEGCTKIGVLNFASAKNPGGGFVNGAMAQEESLATSSTLYRTLTVHEEYYRSNRAQKSMMYTDYGIYSPDVLFFRDGGFRLTAEPVKASVLTLPAVNMGQVRRKEEDIGLAEQVMRRRMKLALAIFAEYGAENLVLGAYGCGVFGNDPEQVADWWKEIMAEGMNRYFASVFYAVLDRSKRRDNIAAFERVFGII